MAGQPAGQAAQVQGAAQVEGLRLRRAQTPYEVLGGPPGRRLRHRVQEHLLGQPQQGPPTGRRRGRDLAGVGRELGAERGQYPFGQVPAPPGEHHMGVAQPGGSLHLPAGHGQGVAGEEPPEVHDAGRMVAEERREALRQHDRGQEAEVEDVEGFAGGP